MRYIPTSGVGLVSLLISVLVARADDAPPTVALTSPADGGTWGATTTLQAKADAFDSDGTITKVEFYVDNVLSGTALTPVQNTLGTYAVNLSPRPNPGAHQLTALAYDSGANVTTSAARTLNVEEPPLPIVTTGDAETTATSVSLHGVLNPNNTYISYRDVYFEIGTSVNYQAKTASLVMESFSGNTDAPITQGTSGLQRNTTYHYRLVAKNAFGKSYGVDATFTTPLNLPPTADDTFAGTNGVDPSSFSLNYDDPDQENVTLDSISTPAHGTVAIVDSDSRQAHLTYTPNSTFIDKDSFTYTVADEHGGTATATVWIADIRKTAPGRYVTVLLSEDAKQVAGEIALNITKTGRFTGVLSYFGLRYPLGGQFSIDGYTQFEIDRQGQPPMSISLSLGGSEQGILLGGSLTVSNSTYELQRNPALIFPTGAPQSGSYTMALPPTDEDTPQGNGYVTGRVNKHGQVLFTGRIGDGQAFSFGTQLRIGGSAQFFVTAGAAPRDRLYGNLQFPDANGTECTGDLLWNKAPRTAGYFQSGFTTIVHVTGSRFDAPSVDESILNYSGLLADLAIDFEDFDNNPVLSGSMSGQDEKSLQFNQGGSRTTKPAAPPVIMSVNPKHGTFTGSVQLPSEPGKRRTFRGVFLQHQNSGSGLIQLDGRTGSVSVTPN